MRNLPIIAIFVIIFIIISIIFIKLIISINKEKRITRFSIDTINDKTKSLFDYLSELKDHALIINSKFLKKLKIFDSYAKMYEKYQNPNLKEKKDGMYYISLKFITGTIFLIVSIITVILRDKPANIYVLILIFLLGFMLPDIILIINKQRYNKRIEEDLLKAVIIMNNAFKSNRSIMQAIELVSTELTGPISEEFKKMFLDLTYGLTLEVVSSKIVFYILACIPIVLFLAIFMLNNSYFNPFFTTRIGHILLLILILLYFIYIIIIINITKLKE